MATLQARSHGRKRRSHLPCQAPHLAAACGLLPAWPRRSGHLVWASESRDQNQSLPTSTAISLPFTPPLGPATASLALARAHVCVHGRAAPLLAAPFSSEERGPSRGDSVLPPRPYSNENSPSTPSTSLSLASRPQVPGAAVNSAPSASPLLQAPTGAASLPRRINRQGLCLL